MYSSLVKYHNNISTRGIYIIQFHNVLTPYKLQTFSGAACFPYSWNASNADWLSIYNSLVNSGKTTSRPGRYSSLVNIATTSSWPGSHSTRGSSLANIATTKSRPVVARCSILLQHLLDQGAIPGYCYTPSRPGVALWSILLQRLDQG